MRTMGVRAFGPAAVIEPLDLPQPVPGEGEVLVRIRFSGVNHIDAAIRNGGFASSATHRTVLPMALGMEGAGVIERAGSGVTAVKPGDRVAFCISRGSHADFAVVPAWRVVKVPDGMSLDIAAALQLQGNTAHYLTTSAFPVAVGDVCLVHAGAGGVSQFLIQLAKLKGATVIATVGSQDKAAVARARGADHIVIYANDDFAQRIMEITGGQGAHVVYDGVGKDTIAGSIRSTRRRGLCINYGSVSGAVGAVSPAELGDAGSVFFTRPHLADYMQDAAEVAMRAKDLFELHKTGKLTVTIDKVVPLEQAREALALVEGRSARGKVLLKVSE